MTFDDKAKDWDKNSANIERALVLAREIIDFTKPTTGMNAFEYGCGTGLLSYFMKDDFKSITLADTSAGMLNILKEKITRDNIANFNPVLLDLTLNDYPEQSEKFDVMYTSMTLHHIPDVASLIGKFNSMLLPGGYLCIADLVAEDGRFHSHLDDFTGHKGFSRNEMEEFLLINGFEIKEYKIALEIEKIFENEEIKKYPVFLIIARKK